MFAFARPLLAAFIVVVTLSSPALAQTAMSSATVAGTVTDPDGRGIPGATIALRSLERNQRLEAVADAQGRYRLLFVGVGQYELAVEAPGFAARTFPLTLTVGQAIDLPLRLSVAGVSTEVQVLADAPLVEARRTQVAGTVTPEQVDSLPLNGRNYLDLALLTPGASRTIQRNTERFAETSAVPGTGVTIAGQRNLSNNFVVDGLSANDDAAGLAGTYFAEDVIREFQVVTSGGVAEFGRASAGIINIVTQSGSNTHRGRVYGFFRDDSLDARNPLATREDPLHQAQYGASVSGPIARDRSFWFANVEQTRLDRTGVITIAPASVEAVNQVLNARGYGGPQLETGEFPGGYHTTNLFGRIDHATSAANRLNARYSLYDVTSDNARSVGGLNAISRGTNLDNRDQTGAVNFLSATASAAVNELRGQVTRSRLGAMANDLAGPAVNIAGVASFGTSTTSPTRRDLDLFQVADSYTMQAGAHLLKGGIDFTYERLDIGFPGALQGVYAFPSLAAFRAGAYTNYQQAFGEPNQFLSNPNFAAFVQDEWRPAGGLTVNAGLRYDVQGLPEPITTDRGNLSPRLGLAYAPGSGRTVVRASGGVYFDRLPLRAVSNALQRDGVKYRAALVTPGQDGAPVFPAAMATFPAGILTNITSIDPRIRSGRAVQTSVQVERQFGAGISATLGYIRLDGDRIVMSRNINVPTLTAAQAAALGIPNLGRPDPAVGNNQQYQSIGRSRFNGLVSSVNARASRLGSFRLSYTWSRAYDDAGNAFFSQPQNAADPAADWGRSDNDQPHRLVLSGSAPIAAGIQLAYLYGYSSAPPFNIQTGTDNNNDTNPNDRPAGIGRNTGEGFDAASLDLRVSRSFTIAGRQRIEGMIEAFNVLNRANYLIPNNTFGNTGTPLAAFGRPTAAADPRQLQFGIRYSY
jgi:hypothetical protein